MDQSYWDYLPVELKCIVLKYRDGQYHREHYKHVRKELESVEVGLIYGRLSNIVTIMSRNSIDPGLLYS